MIGPTALLGELRRTAAGVSWLLARWADLGRAFKLPGNWDETHRFVAIRLLGLRPESVDEHPVIGRIPARTMGLPPPPNCVSWMGEPSVRGRARCGRRGQQSRDGRRENALVPVPASGLGTGPKRPGIGGGERKELQAMVRSERAKLARLMRRVLKANAAEDRAGAADRTMFNDSKSLSLLLRYTTAASRDLHLAQVRS